MSQHSSNFNMHGYDAYHIVRKNEIGGCMSCYVNQELRSTFPTSKSMVVDDVFECTLEIQVSWYRNPRVQI